MVTNNQNMHIDLEEKERVEFAPEDHFLFKIPCKDKISPCRITLQYEVELSKINIFVSTKFHKPSKQLCEQYFLNGQPGRIIVPFKEQPYIYLALESKETQALSMSVQFPTARKR